MLGRIFRALDAAGDKLDGAAEPMPQDPIPQPQSAAPANEIAPGRFPLFTVLAVVFFIVCLTSPIILLTMPVMLTLGMAVVAMFRKERPRWIAPIVAVLVIFVAMAAGNKLNSIGENMRGDSPATVEAAKLEDWNWHIDPDFGTNGTIKWTASVRNTSDRPMSLVKIEFMTYDGSGRLLTSDFTYINAIAAGATRSEQSFADYYGTEKSATAQVVEARFSDN